MNGYIIFSDLKGYSKLTETETRKYFENVNYDLSHKMHKYLQRAEAFNTWGDAVVAVFMDGRDAVDMVLEYRDFFNTYDFEALEMTRLMPRIGGHYGEFFSFKDQLLGRTNMYGSNINTAARVEPVTRTGEIFVTREFKEEIEKLPPVLEYVSFDELGIVELAKSFGEKELFRLYRQGEKPQVIDKIFALDLSGALPPPPELNPEEQSMISFGAVISNREEFLAWLDSIDITSRSGELLFRLAGMCKNLGLYSRSIELVNNLEDFFIETYGIKMYPYKHRQDLLKLKANCLTRLGRYPEAADIVYGLWQIGMKDSDTLSMLAAQYKRRALFNEAGEAVGKDVNQELLIKAKDLYLEAFRRNIEDYYPAINAAYLYRMLGAEESKQGVKLAQYVANSWIKNEGENWWLDSTMAEAQLLQDFYTASYLTFERALQLHQPHSFERASAVEQISTYASITGKQSELREIVALLGAK